MTTHNYPNAKTLTQLPTSTWWSNIGSVAAEQAPIVATYVSQTGNGRGSPSEPVQIVYWTVFQTIK